MKIWQKNCNKNWMINLNVRILEIATFLAPFGQVYLNTVLKEIDMHGYIQQAALNTINSKRKYA